jgi:hypothetical protein
MHSDVATLLPCKRLCRLSGTLCQPSHKIFRFIGHHLATGIIGSEFPISPGNLSEGIEPRDSQKQWDLQEHLQQGRYVYIKRTTVFQYLCKTLNIYLKLKKAVHT